jgi:hypothetical protein
VDRLAVAVEQGERPAVTDGVVGVALDHAVVAPRNAAVARFGDVDVALLVDVLAGRVEHQHPTVRQRERAAEGEVGWDGMRIPLRVDQPRNKSGETLREVHIGHRYGRRRLRRRRRRLPMRARREQGGDHCDGESA